MRSLQCAGLYLAAVRARGRKRLLIADLTRANIAAMKRYSDDGWRMGASVPVGFGVRGYVSAPLRYGRKTKAGWTVPRIALAFVLSAVWGGLILDALHHVH